MPFLEQNGHRRFVWPLWVRVLAFVLATVLVVFGGRISQTLQPWRSAGVPNCLKLVEATGAYRNNCDFPINFGYKVDVTTWPKSQSFPFETLQPNQSTTAWRQVFADVPTGQKFWYFACKAPHVPGMVYSQSNKSITRVGCRRA